MNFILKLFPWKFFFILSIVVIVLAIVFGFYGLYTNQFYLFKISNYILPVLSLVHIAFLYALRFKIKEEEVVDPQMQKLEYALYAITPFYVYKLISTILMLTGASEYTNHAIPESFLPAGITMVIVYALLVILVLMAILHRKKHVGSYNFDEINQIDSWE